MEDDAITTSGTPVRQISVFLHNRVGALMSLVRLLGDHAIAVIGLSVQDSTELTLVRLILSDPEGAETLFMEKGIAHASVPVTVVELHETESGLSGCLATLLAAEINIHFAYPLMTHPGGKTMLVMHLDDGDLGADALMNAGFKLLLQEDLSR